MKRTSYDSVLEYVSNNDTNKNNTKLLIKREEYDLLYKENKTKRSPKLRFSCGICGKEYTVNFSNFKKTQKQCSECGNKMIGDKLSTTYEELKTYIEVDSNSGCKLITRKEELDKEKIIQDISENTHVKLNILCGKGCGRTYKISYKTFKANKQFKCPKCSQLEQTIKMTKSTTQFEEEVLNLVGNKYTILEGYVNANTKLLMRHNSSKCNNYEWRVSPHNFKIGTRCPICSHCSYKKTEEEFKKDVYDIYKDEYTVLGEYINNHTKILVRHNCEECNNHEWTIKPNNLLQGQRCSKCFSRKLKTQEEFEYNVFNLYGDEYSVIGNYVNSITKVLMKHTLCGHEWGIIPSALLNNHGCPKCNMSKGERRVDSFLSNNNIPHDREFIYEDLISDLGNSLRYDFIVFNNGEPINIRCLIEYDGKQHFSLQEGFVELKQFKRLQYHDNQKNEYCIKNHIPLIRIPYWDFNNIEIILEDILSHNNLKSNYIIQNNIEIN